MRIATTRRLFAWDALDDHPDLPALEQFLDALPDEELLAALRQRRAKGRDTARNNCRSGRAPRRERALLRADLPGGGWPNPAACSRSC